MSENNAWSTTQRNRIKEQIEIESNKDKDDNGNHRMYPVELYDDSSLVDMEVYNIDINPIASELCEKNIKLNKLKGDVISINGDATEIIKKQLRDKGDRVLMLLPERSDEFLDMAISSLKKTGVVHYYSHIHAEKKQEASGLSEEHFLSINKIPATITCSRIVRPIGPRFYQTVVDAEIQKC